MADTITVVQYKETDLREEQMDRHKQIKTIDYSNYNMNKRDKGNIGVQYTQNRQKSLDRLSKFPVMLDGRLAASTWTSIAPK